MIQIDIPMPDNCQECQFLFDTLESGTTYYYCFGCGENINQENICITRRPDWCPLREVTYD